MRYKDLLDTDVLDLGKQARPVEGAKYQPGDKVMVEGIHRGVILRSRKMKYHYNMGGKASETEEAIFYTVRLENGKIAEGTEKELKMDPIEYMKKKRNEA